MRIEKFEDIKAWQEARELTKEIFRITQTNNSLERNFRFKEQLTSSSVSVMANIAEGFSRNSLPEFIRFLFIAKASLAELQSHLYVALDQDFIDKNFFDILYKRTDKIARLISKFISYLREKRTQQTQSTL